MMRYLTGGANLTAIALFINRIARLGFNRWFVPSIEFFGGLASLTGMLAPLAGRDCW